MSHIYIAKLMLEDEALPVIKIGKSDDPGRRERQLATKMPVVVKMHAVFDVSKHPIGVYVLESMLHAAYKDSRVDGEWFRTDDPDKEADRVYAILSAAGETLAINFKPKEDSLITELVEGILDSI